MTQPPTAPAGSRIGNRAFSALRCVLLAATVALAGCARPSSGPADANAHRLVSTAPNLTECVCAVGAADQLAGRTEACNYPPEVVRRVPVIGGFGTPSLEPLLAVHPTLVLETVLADPEVKRRLTAAHIPIVHISCARLGEIPDALLRVGDLTGHTNEASVLAQSIRTGIISARADASQRADRPRVLLLCASDTPITCGRHAFISELLEIAGGINIGNASDADYYHVSVEWVLAQNPDLIVCLFETRATDPGRLFERQTGWRGLDAVRRHRVYSVINLDVVCRPGPRVLEGLAEFKRILALDTQRHPRTHD